MRVSYEVTDTYAGEANYCWVNRETEERDEQHTSKRAIVRHLKSMMGVTGERCETEDAGDLITVRPVGKNAPCIIGFATLEY